MLLDNVAATVLLDTGSGVNLIKRSFLPAQVKYQPVNIIVKGITGIKLEVLGKVTLPLNLTKNKSINIDFIVIPSNTSLHTDALFGSRTMSKLKCKLDFELNNLTMNVNNKSFNYALINSRSPIILSANISHDPEIENSNLEPERLKTNVGANPSPRVCAHALDDVSLGAFEQTTCVARCSERDGLYLVHKSALPGGRILVAETLGYVKQGKITVLLLNPGDTPHVVTRNSMLSNMERMEESELEIVKMGSEYSYFMNNNAVANNNTAPSPNKSESLNGINKDEIDCPDEFKDPVVNLLNEYRDVIAVPNEALGRTNIVNQEIVLEPNTAPIYVKQYPVPVHRQEDLSKAVHEMLEKKVIRPSVSPWNSPLILVKKKGGELRPCVDFRRLNDVTVSDRFPLPRISELLQSLSGSVYFTNLDLQTAYWQVEIREEDRQKTAFTTREGHYEFEVMSFGLKNAPSVFSRLMQIVLQGLLGISALVYLDDIVIYSSTTKDHLFRIQQVLERLREANLKLKLKKCSFLQSSIKFLGHKISADGITVHEDHFDAIKNYPAPKNRKQVQRFLGLVSYFRMFLPNFAKIACPITDLLKNDNSFVWGSEQQQAFKTLRESLLKPPILMYPRFDQTFYLATDASDLAVGAVLMQEVDGKLHPIYYASRTLSPAERRYSVTKREALAIIFALRNYKYLILGHETVVYTDHQPLSVLFRKTIPEGQLGRWAVLAQEFDVKIVYIRGKLNVVADCLSRIERETIPKDELLPDEDDLLVDHVAWIQTKKDPPLTWTNNELRRDQRQDARIRIIKTYLEGREYTGKGPKPIVPHLEEYFLNNDIVYRRKSIERLGVVEDIILIVLPESLVKRAVKLSHFPSYHGHPGIDRTLRKLVHSYDSPSLAKAVEVVVKQCTLCTRVKSTIPRPVTVRKFQLPKQPWERVHIDHLGPLPQTSDGNKYIFVLTDALTRYSVIIACRDRTAETVVWKLRKIFAQFGIPTTLVSDNASEFIGTQMSTLCEALGVDKVNITAMHPAANGLVERVNRKIVDLLRLYANDMVKLDWDRYLPEFSLAINASYNATLGDTPFFALFHRDPKLPTELAAGPDRVDYTSYFDYHFDATKKASEIHHYIRDVLAREVDKYTAKANKNRSSRAFLPGDRAFIKRVKKPDQHRKFVTRWLGPVTVIAKKRENAYEIRNTESGRIQVVHIDNMIPLPMDVETREVSEIEIGVDKTQKPMSKKQPGNRKQTPGSAVVTRSRTRANKKK